MIWMAHLMMMVGNIGMRVLTYTCGVAGGSESSLKERIRSGGLRSMLELGVTPSHISMLLEGEEEEGEGEEVRRGGGREHATGGGGGGGG